MSPIFLFVSGVMFAIASIGLVTGIARGGDPDATMLTFIASGVFAIAGVLA